MKFYKTSRANNFDIGIFGLGYESRATSVANDVSLKCRQKIAVGYCHHTNVFCYEKNKVTFKDKGFLVEELPDSEIQSLLHKKFYKSLRAKKHHVIVDITVMSRHRLALILWFFLENLSEESTLTVIYCLSKFLAPPITTPPVKEIGCIINELNGSPSDIGSPTALILSLGYEQNKALGAVNFIDPEAVYAFIPRSEEEMFEKEVLVKNQDLLNDMHDTTFRYNVHQPYTTYLDLKSVVLDILKSKKPILLPLGPKIVAALAVILGKDLYPHLPVWRVSSNGYEEPVDRLPSGHKISFTIEV